MQIASSGTATYPSPPPIMFVVVAPSHIHHKNLKKEVVSTTIK